MADFLSGDVDPEEDFEDDQLGQMGETADEEQMSQLQKRAFEREEKRLDKKLDRIINSISTRFLPFLTPMEKQTVEKAKKHKKLRPKLMIISSRLAMAKFQRGTDLANSAAGCISAGFPFIIVILAALFVAVFIMWIFGLLDSGGGIIGGGNSGGSAPMGPKGKDFYAVRAIYSDDEQAEIDQIEDYLDVLRGVKEQLDSDMDSIDVKFDLTLPEDDKLETFIENKNTGDYIIAYETMKDMADVVYKYDNESGSETDISKQLLAIKYFGYNADIISQDGENNDLTDIIKANLEQYKSTLFAPKEDGGEMPEDLTDKINESVDAYMATVCDKRAEKVYIKDFILDGDDATMEGIEEANYKAIIMYPKGGFEAQFMQFNALDIDVEKFVTYISDNGTKIEFDIAPADNNDYFNKTNMEGDDSQPEMDEKMYNYEIDHSFSIPSSDAPTYLNAIVEGKNVLNLYDILLAGEDGLDVSMLLNDAVDEEGNVVENVYTFKLSGYAIMTEYDDVFGFSITLEPKSAYL